jgi:hypothetical protein
LSTAPPTAPNEIAVLVQASAVRSRAGPASLVAHPLGVGGHREHRAERDQRQAEQVTADRHARERREQLHDGEPGHHQGECRPAPREERPLVGEREPRVGLGAAGVLGHRPWQ